MSKRRRGRTVDTPDEIIERWQQNMDGAFRAAIDDLIESGVDHREIYARLALGMAPISAWLSAGSPTPYATWAEAQALMLRVSIGMLPWVLDQVQGRPGACDFSDRHLHPVADAAATAASLTLLRALDPEKGEERLDIIEGLAQPRREGAA